MALLRLCEVLAVFARDVGPLSRTPQERQKHWVEVKGFETALWRLKKKLLEAVYIHDHPDEKYLIVK